MQPSENFALGSRVVRGMVAGARYDAISNIDKTITVVTLGSVDAIGADEGSSRPLLGLSQHIAPPREPGR
jgi:hypothetical protein